MTAPASSPRIAVVVVTYNSADDVARSLPPLVSQLEPGDELIVVDNASSDATVDRVTQVAPGAKIVNATTNLGFATACNIGVRNASTELVLLLNPDAIPASDLLSQLRTSQFDGIAMGLVLDGDGTAINTSGNILHFTGVAWAGQVGEPLSVAPTVQQQVDYVSGACLAIKRDLWERLGGFPDEYFMYAEDLDLSLRVRLAGLPCTVLPAVRVNHDYEFIKGDYKWMMLERNRIATLARTFPTAVLAVAAPALIATELAIWLAAWRGEWLKAKREATAHNLRSTRKLLRQRHPIQASRQISAYEFAQGLSAELSSPFLGPVADSKVLNLMLRSYWTFAKLLLRLGAR